MSTFIGLPSGGDLDIGTTPILNGTDQRVLFQEAGVEDKDMPVAPIIPNFLSKFILVGIS